MRECALHLSPEGLQPHKCPQGQGSDLHAGGTAWRQIDLQTRSWVAWESGSCMQCSGFQALHVSDVLHGPTPLMNRSCTLSAARNKPSEASQARAGAAERFSGLQVPSCKARIPVLSHKHVESMSCHLEKGPLLCLQVPPRHEGSGPSQALVEGPHGIQHPWAAAQSR